jgi:hypothetical protein
VLAFRPLTDEEVAKLNLFHRPQMGILVIAETLESARSAWASGFSGEPAVATRAAQLVAVDDATIITTYGSGAPLSRTSRRVIEEHRTGCIFGGHVAGAGPHPQRALSEATAPLADLPKEDGEEPGFTQRLRAAEGQLRQAQEALALALVPLAPPAAQFRLRRASTSPG